MEKEYPRPYLGASPRYSFVQSFIAQMSSKVYIMSEHSLSTHEMRLTLAQLDFWEEFSLHPDQPVSTVAHYLDIQGGIDPEALFKAIETTVHETDVLALRFYIPEGQTKPMQHCDPSRLPKLQLIDLQDRADPYQAASQMMQADVAAKLNLLTQPLSVQWLFKLGADRYLWYIRAHHIILDGFGMVLIEQRCAKLYAHYLGKGDAGAPFHSFAQYLDEDQSYCASPRFEKDRAFWDDYLKSAPVALPILHKEDEYYGGEETGLSFEYELPKPLINRMHQIAAQMEMGWPDLLVAISGLYLFYHYRQQDHDGQQALPLWLPFMNRWGSVGAYMPALLVNILPLFIQPKPEATLGETLSQLSCTLRKQRAHGRYRIEQLATDQGLSEGTRYFFSPLVNVLPFDAPEFEGCTVKHQVLASGPGDGFNITYRGRSDAEALILSIDADPSMFQPQEFEQHSQALLAFLEQVLDGSAINIRCDQLLK